MSGSRLPLFVYGTLLSRETEGALLGALERVPAATRGTLYRLPAGYPALSLRGDDVVHGELVAAPDDNLLSLLDRYEGVGEGLFRRAEIDVLLGLKKVGAWAYVMDDPLRRSGRRVASGRWRGAVRR